MLILIFSLKVISYYLFIEFRALFFKYKCKKVVKYIYIFIYNLIYKKLFLL
jgi:hypothetical protein